MRGRLYDPRLSRFTTADPFVTDPLRAQGLNRYAYVQNNPLTFVDPSGFQATPYSDCTYFTDACGGPPDIAALEQQASANAQAQAEAQRAAAEASVRAAGEAQRGQQGTRWAEQQALDQGRMMQPALGGPDVTAPPFVVGHQPSKSFPGLCDVGICLAQNDVVDAEPYLEQLRDAIDAHGSSPIGRALEVYKASGGPPLYFDFKVKTPELKFRLSDRTLNADEFGNYVAGYGAGYALGTGGLPFVALGGSLYGLTESFYSGKWEPSQAVFLGDNWGSVRRWAPGLAHGFAQGGWRAQLSMAATMAAFPPLQPFIMIRWLF